MSRHLSVQLLPLLIYCKHVPEMLIPPDENLLNLERGQPDHLQQTGQASHQI